MWHLLHSYQQIWNKYPLTVQYSFHYNKTSYPWPRTQLWPENNEHRLVQHLGHRALDSSLPSARGRWRCLDPPAPSVTSGQVVWPLLGAGGLLSVLCPQVMRTNWWCHLGGQIPSFSFYVTGSLATSWRTHTDTTLPGASFHINGRKCFYPIFK